VETLTLTGGLCCVGFMNPICIVFFVQDIRDLNLAVVRRIAVQVIKLVLQPDIPCCTEPGLKKRPNICTVHI
jgi:hypothetical protein